MVHFDDSSRKVLRNVKAFSASARVTPHNWMHRHLFGLIVWQRIVQRRQIINEILQKTQLSTSPVAEEYLTALRTKEPGELEEDVRLPIATLPPPTVRRGHTRCIVNRGDARARGLS